MHYVQAFSELHDSWFSRRGRHEYALYLAGGMSNCPNWQKEFTQHFENLKDDCQTMMRCFWLNNLTIINPRRNNYDPTKKSEVKKQTMWEYSHIKSSDAMVFYFPEESICSSALLQYGKCLASNKKIFLGIDESYTKLLDLYTITRLERPDQPINYSLKDLIEEVQTFIEGE